MYGVVMLGGATHTNASWGVVVAVVGVEVASAAPRKKESKRIAK